MENNTIYKEKVNIKIKKPKLFKVIMFNDDFTTMEFVVFILTSIFNKKIEEANIIMLNVHKQGYGIAGMYPLDIAKSKIKKAQILAKEEGFPFRLEVEEE